MNTPPTTGIVNCATYRDGVLTAEHSDPYETYQQLTTGEFVWLDLRDPHESQLTRLAHTYSFHAFALSQALSEKARPMVVQHDGHTLLVIRTVRYVREDGLTPHSETVKTGHIIVLLGDKYVVTIQRGEYGSLADIRSALPARPTWLALGPWTVAHAVVNATIDSYSELSDQFEDAIDEVEESVFGQHSSHVSRIYQLKRELVEFKRAVTPLSRVTDRLAFGNLEGITAALVRAFTEAAEHQHKVADQIVAYDDLLTSILSASLTQVGIQQNSDMRKISAWAAIIGVQTTIAGIYGMNFRHMPELHWMMGYPLALGAMAVSAMGLYILFRRSNWL